MIADFNDYGDNRDYGGKSTPNDDGQGGYMKKWIMIFSIMLAVALSGCSGKKAEEKYETAQFEELQKNYDHARALYQEIIEKFPDSQYAKKASERLKALETQD